jgi:hypothetical protein
MLKFIFILLLASVGLEGQVTPAKNVQVGRYSCAGRMLGPKTFQHWCYREGKIVINSVLEILEDNNVMAYYADTTVTPVGVQICWNIAPPNIYSVTIKVGEGSTLTMNGVF